MGLRMRMQVEASEADIPARAAHGCMQPARHTALFAPAWVRARAHALPSACSRLACTHAACTGLPRIHAGSTQTCRVGGVWAVALQVGCDAHPTASAWSATASSSAAAGRARTGWLGTMASWGAQGGGWEGGRWGQVGSAFVVLRLWSPRDTRLPQPPRLPCPTLYTGSALPHALSSRWRTCDSTRSSRATPGVPESPPNRTPTGSTSGALGPAAAGDRACTTAQGATKSFSRSSVVSAHTQASQRRAKPAITSPAAARPRLGSHGDRGS